MRKIIAIFLSILLSCMLFLQTSSLEIAKAEDINNNQELVVEKQIPQKPTFNDNMNIDEINTLINQYNAKVDDYNDYVKTENEKRQAAYKEEIEEINAHNNIERLKVDENTQALEKQEKRKQRIISDQISKLDFYTDIPNNIPTSWEDETSNLITSSVESDELSNNKYKVINLHIFLKDGASETYETSTVTDNSFQVSQDTTLNMLRAEWETFTVDENDTITLTSLNSLYPHNGAIFTRFFDGYTNGYWMPTQEFVCTANYVEDLWEDGPLTVFSYSEGSTDNQGIKNILNVYTYTFVRLGTEPKDVEKYEPDFLNYPDLELLSPIEKMNNVEKTKKEEEKEKEKEEKEKEDNKEKEEKKKDNSKEKESEQKKEKTQKTNDNKNVNNNPNNSNAKDTTTKEITTNHEYIQPSSTKTAEKTPATGDNNSDAYILESILIGLAVIALWVGYLSHDTKKNRG